MTAIPETMCGVELMGHGGLDMLRYRDDLPVPKPGRGDVLVRVRAAGVNATDLNLRTGWYARDEAEEDGNWRDDAVDFPLVQGADVCGVVAAVGQGVSEHRIAQRVIVEPILWERHGQKLEQPLYLGTDCPGGFAEYVVVASRHAFSITSDASDVELGAVPCSSSAAENLLTRSSVGSDDRVLVTGASGGVGSAAVQLAVARGASVVAVASASKADAVRDLGASQVITRGTSLVDALGQNAVSVVIDVVGGSQFAELLDVLRPRGRYATSGAIGGAVVELDLRTLYLKDLSMFGGTVIGRDVFPALVRRIEAGELRPPIAGVYPLQEIAAAQQALASKQHVGKLVLIP
ncbi:MAG: zinc-binding dehydrogenase [Trueperaceae bacterium]|nr:zinc-binding dehydrogenase [Trueperaceae bacterium]